MDLSDESRMLPGDPTIIFKIANANEQQRDSSVREDSTTHPPPQPPPPNNYIKSIRSGVLKLRLDSQSHVIFGKGKGRTWKEKYVHIDETQGIIICPDRASYEKNDKKSFKILPFSDIAGVLLKKPEDAKQETISISECQFVVYVKPRAQFVFGPELELQTMAGMQDAEEWVQSLRQKILVKARVYTVGLNGEFPENNRGVKPNIAITFSGGGGRAHVCAGSQLRAFHHLGVLHKNKIDYLSGVSAGAWATGVFTFYEKGAKNDDELLGPLIATDLKKWTMDALQNESTISPIIKPALQSCMKVASEMVWTINSHELWEKVMGKIYLKPFGLNKDWPFALREDVEAIKKENPHLQNTRFAVTRTSERPFWICHGTIIGPDWAKIDQLLPIQFTALYSGSPYLHKIHYEEKLNSDHDEVVWVGGGMVDSFAFGGDEPASAVGLSNRNTVSHKKKSPHHSTTRHTHHNNRGSLRSFFLPKSSSTQGLIGKDPKETTEINAPTAKLPTLASTAFADLMAEQAAANGNPCPNELQKIDEMNEAMSTFNLAPQMIQRVFRNTQEALKHNKNLTIKKVSSEHDYEGVLAKEVSLPYPEVPFSLRHTLGISSDAPSVNLHEKTTFRRLNVQERYWTPVFVNAEEFANNGKNDTEFNLSQNIATTHAVTMDMGDGGTLDNLGICGMLQRGVRKIICCINTNNTIPVPGSYQPPKPGEVAQKRKIEWDASRRLSNVALNNVRNSRRENASPVNNDTPTTPTSTTTSTSATSTTMPPSPAHTAPETPRKKSVAPLDPATITASFASISDTDDPPTFEEWCDDDILPLFGQAVDEKMLNYLGTHHSHNHIFPITELRPLLRKLQAEFIKGNPMVVREQHQVLDNHYWGIEGGWKVDILWIYLDDSYLFRSMLPDDTIQELDKGKKGEFARFPNFKTFGNNATLSFDISLTPRQINLLSSFSEWQIMSNKQLILDFIDEPLPPLERKKKKLETAINQLEKEGFC